MIWVNPKVDMTEDEFDAWLDKMEEEGDIESMTADEVSVTADDLFDHTYGEIQELEGAPDIAFSSEELNEEDYDPAYDQ